MARVALKSISFFAFIFISAVLLATSESVESVTSGKPVTAEAAVEKKVESVKPEAKAEEEVVQPQRLCAKPSGTWSGYCGSSSACNNECIAKERMASGSCQWKGLARACTCFYNC